jgi:hypothetical protein
MGKSRGGLSPPGFRPFRDAPPLESIESVRIALEYSAGKPSWGTGGALPSRDRRSSRGWTAHPRRPFSAAARWQPHRLQCPEASTRPGAWPVVQGPYCLGTPRTGQATSVRGRSTNRFIGSLPERPTHESPSRRPPSEASHIPTETLARRRTDATISRQRCVGERSPLSCAASSFFPYQELRGSRRGTGPARGQARA